MSNDIHIVDLNDSAGNLVFPAWLAKAELVHRQLRPQLPIDYAGKMRRVFASGARMSVAVCNEDVVGVAVHRMHENTYDGLQMYVDDLVTDDAQRSRGIGKILLDHLQRIAHASGCRTFQLDSGTQRQQAHKFYFREGMVVTSFHFRKSLESVRASIG
jgi:GNAT superfamily N-acetyltransferase